MKSAIHDRQTSHRRPRGVAILAALVCLIVMSALIVTITRTVLTRAREVELYRSQLQAELLLESAWARATVQYRNNPNWSGEQWKPEVSGSPQLKADMEIIPLNGSTVLRIICVVPANSPAPVRVERTFPWPPVPHPVGVSQ